jgi:1,4-dihydroxy-2-naphthoyl-CoA hydrolase
MIWWNGERPSLDRLNQLHHDTLPGLIGIEFVDCGDDWISARLPVDRRTVQPFGRLHGGASVVLAEAAGSMAAGLCVDPGRFTAVGMEINANPLRPAHSGWVTAVARPEAMGRTTQVWSIRIEDEAGKLVCISRLTIAVIAQTRM